MAKIKIFLEKGETPESADLALLKALNLHVSGDIHLDEDFADPAMTSAVDKLEELYKNVSQKMMAEIMSAIDGEYGNL